MAKKANLDLNGSNPVESQVPNNIKGYNDGYGNIYVHVDDLREFLKIDFMQIESHLKSDDKKYFSFAAKAVIMILDVIKNDYSKG